jgi:HK97 family phage portal protein
VGLFTRKVGKKAIIAPDGLRVTELPNQYTRILRLYDNIGSAYDAIYRTQHNVRVVVDDTAREAAELTLKVYEKVPRSPTLPSARLEIPDHPMAELLSEPMPEEFEDENGFWFKLFADILIYDIAHWQVIAPNGTPEALLRLPPQSITPDRDPTTYWVRGWRGMNGGYIPREDVITFWGYDPRVNHGSTSPMETLRRLLAEEVARDQNRQGMWKRSLRKDGVIEIDADGRQLSDDARESWLIDAEDALAGYDQSGRPLILEPGWHFKDSQFSPRDMEYLKGRLLSRQEVASAFHTPPAKVAAAENGQQPDENTLRIFYQSTLPPLLSRVESQIKSQLLPRFDLNKTVRRRRYVKFNLDEKLRGAFEDRAAIMATTAGGPIVSVNEARGRLDLPPVDGFDGLYQPLNSVMMGGPQASPNNPVDTPADLNPAGTTPGGGTKPPNSVEGVVKLFDEQRGYQNTLAKYQKKHERVLVNHFARQRNAAKAGKSVVDERWDRELKADLAGVAIEASVEFGPYQYDEGLAYTEAREINLETDALLSNEDELSRRGTEGQDARSEERRLGRPAARGRRSDQGVAD